MGTLENTFLGIAFWVVGLANILLMFKLWGYPFDHERLVSSAPRSLMLLHRVLGPWPSTFPSCSRWCRDCGRTRWSCPRGRWRTSSWGSPSAPCSS